jgi:hypothetical protein
VDPGAVAILIRPVNIVKLSSDSKTSGLTVSIVGRFVFAFFREQSCSILAICMYAEDDYPPSESDDQSVPSARQAEHLFLELDLKHHFLRSVVPYSHCIISNQK